MYPRVCGRALRGLNSITTGTRMYDTDEEAEWANVLNYETKDHYEELFLRTVNASMNHREPVTLSKGYDAKKAFRVEFATWEKDALKNKVSQRVLISSQESSTTELAQPGASNV